MYVVQKRLCVEATCDMGRAKELGRDEKKICASFTSPSTCVLAKGDIRTAGGFRLRPVPKGYTFVCNGRRILGVQVLGA
jgi:hypothetical protein